MFMPLFSVVYPANAEFYCKMLLEVASFDALPAEEINSEVWHDSLQTEDDSIGKFESLGYDGPFMVSNLITMQIMLGFTLIFNLIFIAATVTLGRFSKFCKSRVARAKGLVLWRMPHGFLIESYSVITICCILNVQHLDWANAAVSFNSAIALITLVFLTSYPAVLVAFLIRNRDNLDKRSFLNKFEPMY